MIKHLLRLMLLILSTSAYSQNTGYVFEENFDNNNNNWHTGVNSRIQNGFLTVFDNQTYVKNYWWNINSADFDINKDFSIEYKMKCVHWNRGRVSLIFGGGKNSAGKYDYYRLEFGFGGTFFINQIADGKTNGMIHYHQNLIYPVKAGRTLEFTVQKTGSSIFFFQNGEKFWEMKNAPIYGTTFGIDFNGQLRFDVDYIKVYQEQEVEDSSRVAINWNHPSLLDSTVLDKFTSVSTLLKNRIDSLRRVDSLLAIKNEQPGEDGTRTGTRNGGLEDPNDIPNNTDIGTYHALLIGINDYDHLKDLHEPINDVNELKNLLVREYTFSPDNVKVIRDGTREQILDALGEIGSKIRKNDNLFIYYAGHGVYDENENSGFWQPKDAKKYSDARWIANSRIQSKVKGYGNKHTLIVNDACFGGSLTRDGSGGGAPQLIKNLFRYNARIVMASGNKEEVVPDESLFHEKFMARLKGNPRKYFRATKLFSEISDILQNSRHTPVMGTLPEHGHDGGDFIFIRKTY